MKMTFFGLFFIPADGRAKSAQQLISTMLPFHPLYFPCLQPKKKLYSWTTNNVHAVSHKDVSDVESSCIIV